MTADDKHFLLSVAIVVVVGVAAGLLVAWALGTLANLIYGPV